MTGATNGQLGAIVVVLAEHGVTTRDHRIAIVAGLAGRPLLASTKELTARQAREILEHFDQLRGIDELRMLVEQYRPTPVGGA